MRRRLGSLLSICFLFGLSLFYLKGHRHHAPIDNPPLKLHQEIPPSTETSHPIHQLIAKAEKEHEKIIARQSDSLQKAVEEYKRRYRLPPPPNFDQWYEFAKVRNVQLIDEYDTIYHSLLPFWGLSPSVIRGRARESLGFKDNALVGIIIRDGRVITAAGGTEWQQKATVGMLEQFIQNLPSMDLTLNVH